MNASPTISMAHDAAQAALQTANARWQTTFDAMLDPVALLDADGTILQCNRAFAAFLGQDAAAVVGQPCHQVLHHTDQHIPGCPLVRARASGVRETMELPVGERTFLVVTDPMVTPDGAANGFAHVMHDITEQRRMTEALRESEARYRTIADHLPNGIVHIFDRDFRYLFNAGEELLKIGLTNELLVGKTIFDVLGTELGEWVAEHYRRVLAGETVRFEGDFGGQSFLVHAAPLRDARGQVDQILVLSINVTDRVQAEELARLSQERTQIIVDAAPFGAHSYVLAAADRLVFSGYNPAADRILGIDHAPLLGKTIEQAFPALAHTPIPASYRQVAASGSRYDEEQVEYSQGQVHGAFEIHAFQSGPRQMTVFFRDITERKRAEAQLAGQLDELRRWQAVTLGREARILDLKREVNALLARTGQPVRYPSAETENS